MSNAELCSRKNKTGQISDHTMDEQQSNHDWDVVIVGAGPVGGHTANLLVKKGHRVLLLEEHNEIGRPFQCAGLVTPNAMKQVGLCMRPSLRRLTEHLSTDHQGP